ncbi:hypothetical protein RF11_16343 [Thelohanellus kitauei]|uniref:Uncharacterized protein n=1 Tax=Thelohanellus kitauei TaxID=669202 RepID=A0A0C2MPE2_THEKT|nr:hypothetical protein RF11_16343 [Thelohanellus kitauei]
MHVSKLTESLKNEFLISHEDLELKHSTTCRDVGALYLRSPKIYIGRRILSISSTMHVSKLTESLKNEFLISHEDLELKHSTTCRDVGALYLRSPKIYIGSNSQQFLWRKLAPLLLSLYRKVFNVIANVENYLSRIQFRHIKLAGII